MRYAVILFLIAASFFFGCKKTDQTLSGGKITFTLGDVRKNGADVKSGDILGVKETLTTGKESYCDIMIGSSSVRVKENSKIVLAAFISDGKIENVALDMEIGKMLCRPKKLLKSESFIVKTPTAVAGVRGTSFSIESDEKKTSKVMVFDGQVKVAMRIKQLDKSDSAMLDAAPEMKSEDMVKITEKEVVETEKIIEKKLELMPEAKDSALARGGAIENQKIVAALMLDSKKDLVISDRKIEKFEIGKTDDLKEMENISVTAEKKPSDTSLKEESKPAVKIKELNKGGRLLILRDKTIYASGGKVIWEGGAVTPVQHGGRYYIATGNYIFCTLTDGTVIWVNAIQNNGTLEIKGNSVEVPTSSGSKLFELSTGKAKL